ncbi:MAG: hypothetical protein EWM45_07175 [Rhodopseudomonas palustris]|nr:MAG: hypothetical protein EWM45_07175 [Rhodopseudomonas palustris]
MRGAPLLPSPACGRGAGGEGNQALCSHCPHPNPLPQAGEGARRRKGEGWRVGRKLSSTK